MNTNFSFFNWKLLYHLV